MHGSMRIKSANGPYSEHNEFNSIPSCPTSLISTLLLPPPLHLCFPCNHFSPGFPTKKKIMNLASLSCMLHVLPIIYSLSCHNKARNINDKSHYGFLSILLSLPMAEVHIFCGGILLTDKIHTESSKFTFFFFCCGAVTQHGSWPPHS
jgi:hypothetical protein